MRQETLTRQHKNTAPTPRLKYHKGKVASEVSTRGSQRATNEQLQKTPRYQDPILHIFVFYYCSKNATSEPATKTRFATKVRIAQQCLKYPRAKKYILPPKTRGCAILVSSSVYTLHMKVESETRCNKTREHTKTISLTQTTT